MAGGGLARSYFPLTTPRPAAPVAPTPALGPEYRADRSTLRSERGQDEGAQQGSFMGLLDALNSRGFLKSGGSVGSASGGLSAGVWTPEMPSAGGMVSGSAPAVPHIDTTAARSAAFNRAKDQVGQTSSAAVTALRSALAGRGMLGSGRESRATANVINAGQAQLGEVSRDNAIKDVDVAEREAALGYQGGITQRGQDLEALGERNRLRLAARGQDLSAEGASTSASDNRLRAILGLYSAFRGGARY